MKAKRFARYLRGLRESRFASLRGFSAELKIHRNRLHRLERGESEPTLAEIEKIARAMRVDVPTLLAAYYDPKKYRAVTTKVGREERFQQFVETVPDSEASAGI